MEEALLIGAYAERDVRPVVFLAAAVFFAGAFLAARFPAGRGPETVTPGIAVIGLGRPGAERPRRASLFFLHLSTAWPRS